MSIDLGTEFMKVAVVLPGKPMEIALTPDSRRKTSTAVGFKNNERLFGSNAISLASRNPEYVFQSIPSLLGKSIDHPMVKLFQERYPYHNLSYDATSGQLFFSRKDGVVFSVDELVAMLLEYAHNYAELYAAYSYGKHRDGDVVADFPMLRIVNVSHDPTFGTQAFIYRIRDQLLEKFCEIKKLDKDLVKKSHRAMSKLALEASNVLTKLSANSEIFAQVENLFNEEDLNVKITRAEMEAFCSDLFERVKRPFFDIMVDFSMESLQEVILMGGGTRIPKIQSVLIEYSQKSELHRGVNSDDAAALGAVYQAAFHTPGFRVTRFIVKDYNLYPIAVDFMRAPPLPSDKSDKDSHIDDQQDGSYVRQVLFPRGAIFPQKRAIKFNRHINDLDFYVNYVDLDGDAARFQGPNYNLSHITTRNVSKSAKHYSFAEPRGVKAHFIMDHNGILVLSGVSCIFHPIEKKGISNDSNKAKSTFEKIGSTLSGLFGGGDGANVDKNVPEQDTAVNTTDDGGVNLTHVNTVNITKNSSTGPFFEPIDYEVVYLDFPDLTAKESIVSQSKLEKLREADKERAALDQSINLLETLLLNTNDMISTDYKKYGTEEELKQLDNVLQIASSWFDEQGHTGLKNDYDIRIKEIQSLIIPIERRSTEIKHRAKAILSFNKTIELAQKTLNEMVELSKLFSQTLRTTLSEQQQNQNASNNSSEQTSEESSPWKNIFTEVEIDTLRNKLGESKTWLAESTEVLNKSPTYEDPPILVSTIRSKEGELSREISYHTTKMNLWRSEIARMFAEQSKMNTADPLKDKGQIPTSTSGDDKTISGTVKTDEEPTTKTTEDTTRTPRPEL
ncbi:Hypoxia up-regulated protein 1, variant 3 [Schistosoma haematobium]|uniref:Hypoxia up-regulated protein 1 n=1 Tax=Schistosoma haematobium TaxID=6185 RepID=A0A922LZ90_SCHHA|nr:Hypoxia up-regulated protein 1, variant 3 [Schistosoma haematobium]KAH9596503.1 Hypoxia up-regulated protein 1, variant 3 [Schistosoma haematobium]